jgi:hypothetical protein
MVSAEGIDEGRHGSPAVVAAMEAETGVGAGVDAGVAAGVDAVGVVGVSLLESLLDPQPLIADTKINASGANAVNALDR